MRRLTLDQVVSTVSTPVSPPSPPPSTPPGSFFLAVIPGMRGRGISAAQAFARGGSLWTHAGMYLGGEDIIQAEPSGVRVRSFPDRYCSGPVLWSDAPIQRHLADVPGAGPTYERDLRRRVVDAARDLIDSGYAWLDILIIGAAEWNVPGWQQLRKRVDLSQKFLCSSLVDRAYADAGVHLFSDHRPSGQVTPADLARYDESWVRERLDALENRVTSIEERLQ